MKQFLFLLILFPALVFCQKNENGLLVEKTTIDYGEVENWISEIDSIHVVNTTSKQLYLLGLKYPREFEVFFPRKGLKPGEEGFIKIIYKPKKEGKFNQKLQLYHSNSNDPFYITFKGNVLSFDPYSDLACPSFSKPNFNRFIFNLEVEVIDSITKKPISKALVEIYKHEKFITMYTNSNGLIQEKSNVGLYEFFVQKQGYKSKYAFSYFNPRNRKLIIPLSKQKVEQIILPIEVDDRTSSIDELPELSINKSLDTIKFKPFILPNDTKEEFSLNDYKKNNLVFLVDVSASMRGDDRLELLKTSMIELINLLRPEDEITLITYSDEANVLLEKVNVKDKKELISLIKNLKARGSTQGGKAIKKAYEIAEENYIKDGNNQIILATDGGFNGLGKSERSLNRLVKRYTKKNIFFSVLAFGKNNYGKEFMRDLSTNGQGNYLYIKDELEAKKELKETIKYQSLKRK